MKGLLRLCRAAIVAVVGFTHAPVLAAQSQDSACPSEPTRLVVLGDSLADGLWGSLNRSYARCPTVEVVRLTAVSDGLAKTSDAGWLKRYARVATKLDTRASDIVLVQIGANDITTIRNGSIRESFASDTWTQIYAGRVVGLTRALKARTAQVIWFGLPVVGNTKLEAPYQAISKLQRGAVKSAGGRFIDIHELTKFGTGDFSMNGPFAGRIRQLRAPDKVHFTKSGYDFVAHLVLNDLARLMLARDRRASLQNVTLQ